MNKAARELFSSCNAMQVYSRLLVCVVFLLFLSVVCVCLFIVHMPCMLHNTYATCINSGSTQRGLHPPHCSCFSCLSPVLVLLWFFVFCCLLASLFLSCPLLFVCLFVFLLAAWLVGDLFMSSSFTNDVTASVWFW